MTSDAGARSATLEAGARSATFEAGARSATLDLVIRGGTIVDGLGGDPFVGDVAVQDDVIVAVGTVDGTGTREIDATGLLVTPGFVDLHTHYDGQAIWSERMTPSSAHGVTTAVMGNCGVGFAPCRPEDHETLVDVMAGVEDIPGVVMVDGLPWTWETFPEFLDALDGKPRDIDVAAFLPHSPLRVYVMGRRGVEREAATAEDLALMRKLAAEAIQVGALGFASSQLTLHKSESGHPIPSYGAAHAEFEAIAQGIKDSGGGLLQFVPDLVAGDYEPALKTVFDVAEDVGLPVTFTLAIGNMGDPFYVNALTMVEKANAAGGDISAQIFPRPIGLVIGLELSGNPFILYPSYREIAHLPLAERVAEMRKPEVRERILADKPASDGHPLMFATQAWNWMFPLGDPPNYEPDPSESIAARAEARGVSPLEEAYDRVLDDDGHAMLLITLANFRNASLDTVAELIRRDDVVLGLGDGGAHYGMICDASFPTYMLAHWARDRASGRLTVAEAVRELTSAPARVAGLSDRGRIAVGYKADLNVIDHSALTLHKPVIAHDLPAGGRRLDQTADGYVATVVSGEVIAENGAPTDARPGRLIRGRQAAPA
ncbi:amidohydrolase family protein [Mycolicibacterium sp. CR10]|uniref:N-acyl-D-amino-acid deacylase family protein n=1 Tax=Mycolicibacterium sp. CR10 TaxID=2562314 RepID=UPI0010BF8083|nr:amidohydrolase family protein [Mycolicibacterium sp. CR10]